MAVAASVTFCGHRVEVCGFSSDKVLEYLDKNCDDALKLIVTKKIERHANRRFILQIYKDNFKSLKMLFKLRPSKGIKVEKIHNLDRRFFLYG